MEFDELQVFAGRATKIFEMELDKMIEIVLDAKGDDFDVITSVRDSQIILSDEAAEEERTGLRVSIAMYVDVRSGTTYTTASLIDDMKTVLDEEGERETFILALQDADTTFSSINFMNKFSINDEEIPLIKKEGTNIWMYIGPGIGGVALITAVFAFVFIRRQGDEMSFINNGDFYDPPPIDQRVSATIEVGDDIGELSTLGDTSAYPHGQHGMFNAIQPTMNQEEDQETNQSDFSADYDYKRAYLGAGEEPSVSTASGNRSTYAPHSLADRMNDEDPIPRQRIGTDVSDVSRVKSMNGNVSLFSDDQSFEAMYHNEEEEIVVVAPAGKLGVVIDTPSGGIPMVHAIKDTSALADSIRIKDKLISVDNEDTTTMSALQVSKLISSKAMNPERVMVFLRSNDP